MKDISLTLSPSSWVKDIQTDDGAALLDTEHGVCYSMNPVGSRIWSMVKLHYPVDRMSEIIAGEFKISIEKASDDVIEFLRTLIKKGLAACARQSGNSERRNWFAAFLSRLKKGRNDHPQQLL
jgi:hypothetical protein